MQRPAMLLRILWNACAGPSGLPQIPVTRPLAGAVEEPPRGLMPPETARPDMCPDGPLRALLTAGLRTQ